jgi:hypothetical protein
MDGHGSYLSDHFKFYAFRNRIVPFLLPSHPTHLLQPLDAGVFSAMKQHHQDALYDLSDMEITHFIVRTFWRLSKRFMIVQ